MLCKEELNLLRYKTVVNQRKVGCSILQKSRSNVEKRLNEEERLQNDVTASVSADHDYNGQNSGTNGNYNTNILQSIIYIFFGLHIVVNFQKILILHVYKCSRNH